jgi:hypothetical protein
VKYNEFEYKTDYLGVVIVFLVTLIGISASLLFFLLAVKYGCYEPLKGKQFFGFFDQERVADHLVLEVIEHQRYRTRGSTSMLSDASLNKTLDSRLDDSGQNESLEDSTHN